MDHIHFLTELELSAAEKKSILHGFMLRQAIENCRSGERQVAIELMRIERLMQDRSVLHLVPVDDDAVLGKRALMAAS